MSEVIKKYNELDKLVKSIVSIATDMEIENEQLKFLNKKYKKERDILIKAVEYYANWDQEIGEWRCHAAREALKKVLK